MPVTIDGTTGITAPAIDVATPVTTADGGTGLSSFTTNGAMYATSTSALTTGTLPVASGGTGAASLTADNVLLGNGTSAVQFVAPGSSGNILTSNGTTWVSSTPAGGVSSLNGQTGAITNTDYGAIGSYVIAAENDYTISLERLPDVTVAGSTLVRSNNPASPAQGINAMGGTNVDSTKATSLSLSGTWRRLTRSLNGTAGTVSGINLYVRVS